MSEFKTQKIIDPSKKVEIGSSVVGLMSTEIASEQIRNKVMSEISMAKKEILATMDIAEERNSPLPVEYFSLLTLNYETQKTCSRLLPPKTQS